MMNNPMIQPDQHVLLWSILLAVSLFGMYGERIGWFRKISGALITIILAAVFVSTGMIPSASNPSAEVMVYDMVFTYFIPFSIPLLLFNVQMKKIVQETGTLLLPFLIGSAGIVLGALIAHNLLDLGEESYKVAGTFIGTYTGGSVNFMSVATALDFLNSPLFTSTITVDNVFTNLYVVLLFILPGIQWIAEKYPAYNESESVATRSGSLKKTQVVPIIEQITFCLLLTAVIFVMAHWISPIISQFLNTKINLEILIITVLIIILVNFFPSFFEKYQELAFDLGMVFMYVFLAVIGASSNILELFTSVPGILLFAAITLIVHLAICFIAAKFLKISLKEAMLASCANAAGPSVAAPMAVSFGMKKAVTPAILIGLLGYVIGTFLGVGIGVFLQ